MGAMKDHLMNIHLESKRERGTIIFALEEYAQLLEKEKDYQSRNRVWELIWRIAK